MTEGTPVAGRQFVSFVGVGAIAAGANFSSRFVFGLLVPFGTSVVLAFFIGLTTAFVLNRRYVFSGERASSWRSEALRFLVVNVFGLGVTLAAAIVSLRLFDQAVGPASWTEGLAHLVGLGATAVTSYVAHKYWTFAT